MMLSFNSWERVIRIDQVLDQTCAFAHGNKVYSKVYWKIYNSCNKYIFAEKLRISDINCNICAKYTL